MLLGEKSGGTDMLVNSDHCFYGFHYKCSNVEFHFYHLKHFNVLLCNACPFLLICFCGQQEKNSNSKIAALSNPVVHCLGCKIPY